VFCLSICTHKSAILYIILFILKKAEIKSVLNVIREMPCKAYSAGGGGGDVGLGDGLGTLGIAWLQGWALQGVYN
jgi:hypothetical protein